MNRTHSAKYLILLGPPNASRALLFNGEHRYLTEMIDDDGIMVDALVKSSRVCAPPSGLQLEAANASPFATCDNVRCFALG
jgi:hypothetical protein